jgi:hypothetical protein
VRETHGNIKKGSSVLNLKGRLLKTRRSVQKQYADWTWGWSHIRTRRLNQDGCQWQGQEFKRESKCSCQIWHRAMFESVGWSNVCVVWGGHTPSWRGVPCHPSLLSEWSVGSLAWVTAPPAGAALAPASGRPAVPDGTIQSAAASCLWPANQTISPSLH